MAPPGRRLTVVQTGRWATIGLFVLAMIAALRVGSSLLIPILMSGLLALLLAPAVAWLVRHRMPHSIAAALVMLTVVGSVGTTIVMLSGPASAWLANAPKTLTQAERKIRRLTKPIEQLQATAKKVEEVAQSGSGQGSQAARPTGQTAPGGLFQKLSGTTVSFAGALVTVIFLSYFLLATAHRFRAKLDDILPTAERASVTEAISEMQQQMSRYLLTVTSINIALGLVTWGVMVLNGMPNPALWGVIAGVLNFVPYLGALVTLAIILLAGLVSFDESGRAFLAAGSFFVVNMLEGNVITPTIMGRRLPLNPVAIFGGLLFWGWLWGVTGAILAVPLTACLKVMADRIEPMKPVGEMLGP
ncbi:MAG TPA: AI-2E family transporter [Gemmatimonadales bacterium]|nr:AI-2E family transporter [Gemmatimonadales bacterium]